MALSVSTGLLDPRRAAPGAIIDDPMGYRAKFRACVRELLGRTVERRVRWRIVNPTTAVTWTVADDGESRATEPRVSIQRVSRSEDYPGFVLQGMRGGSVVITLKSWERPELEVDLDQLHEQAMKLAARSDAEEAERRASEDGIALLREVLGEK